MFQSDLAASGPNGASHTQQRIGCVSFLNAKPLIEGIDGISGPQAYASQPQVILDVPSHLLQKLEAGNVDIALCPLIDYWRSTVPLEIIPVGGISSDGATLTVRLISRVPIEQIDEVCTDTDSHTSVVLLRILLRRLHRLCPRMIDYRIPERTADQGSVAKPQAMLLIGDKVIAGAPAEAEYPHQLDLGWAWRRLTGLPFVFAVWMARQGTNLGELPARLEKLRIANSQRLDQIARRYAPVHHWPVDLAEHYLKQVMRYTIGEQEIRAMQRFATLAQQAGLIRQPQPLRIRT